MAGILFNQIFNMKKLLFAFALTATVAISTQAQEVYVQGGLNLANITKTRSEEHTSELQSQ